MISFVYIGFLFSKYQLLHILEQIKSFILKLLV